MVDVCDAWSRLRGALEIKAVNIWTAFLIPLVLGILTGGLIFFLSLGAARRQAAAAVEEADSIVAEARERAMEREQEILGAAQEKAISLEDELDRREQDLDHRETGLDKTSLKLKNGQAALERNQSKLEEKLQAAETSRNRARELETLATAAHQGAVRDLERVAGLTADEAREELLEGIREEAVRNGAGIARKIEDEAREVADREAMALVVRASQKVDMRQFAPTTVSYVELPGDEMKGRIIGREGRNIRAIENATGIDLIIDDTPNAILISSFDAARREMARIAIQRLVEDGRIHPARIEEVVAKVRSEFEELVEEAGNQAAFSLGISDLPPKLARRIGRLQFRTYHGQNLLRHSLEVALLAGHIAAQIGAQVEVVHRAGLFHEIGAVDDTVTGHTALTSSELAGKFGESPAVVHAIQALHPDVEASSMEAMLLNTANRLSNNRPGARKDNLEVFIERLTRLEAIALRNDAVKQAIAVKSGKEVRVLLDATVADDNQAYVLAGEIARSLEKELVYPGQIKVSVLRETRAVHYAV
jgi:ribonuclease Y